MKAIDFLKRNKKRIAYVLTTICMLLFGLFSGMLIGPKEAAEQAPTHDPAGEMTGVLSVLPAARVEFHVSFESCGHEVIVLGNESLAGKTREEAEKAYPGWTLETFSGDEVVFTKTSKGYCPKHYVLRLAGGELGVYRTDETTYEEKRLMVLDWEDAAFDSAERAELEAGIAFDDLNGVNAYLESAES